MQWQKRGMSIAVPLKREAGMGGTAGELTHCPLRQRLCFVISKEGVSRYRQAAARQAHPLPAGCPPPQQGQRWRPPGPLLRHWELLLPEPG